MENVWLQQRKEDFVVYGWRRAECRPVVFGIPTVRRQLIPMIAEYGIDLTTQKLATFVQFCRCAFHSVLRRPVAPALFSSRRVIPFIGRGLGADLETFEPPRAPRRLTNVWVATRVFSVSG